MLVSIVVPSIRDTSLNERCLARQTFKDFEVIIQRPTRPLPQENFYDLNHDYNLAIKKAKGELIISYQDQIEIKPDCIERFWNHYQTSPRAIVGAVGNQYSTLHPPITVWVDPRKRTDLGSFYPCMPDDIEFTLCSIPKVALYEVGAFDEEFDKYAAISEKELSYRMFKAGYEPYLDQSIEYMALKHDRLFGKDTWDKHYFAGIPYYKKCLKEIDEGVRSVDFLRS
jgi:hypothetical protein